MTSALEPEVIIASKSEIPRGLTLGKHSFGDTTADGIGFNILEYLDPTCATDADTILNRRVPRPRVKPLGSKYCGIPTLFATKLALRSRALENAPGVASAAIPKEHIRPMHIAHKILLHFESNEFDKATKLLEYVAKHNIDGVLPVLVEKMPRGVIRTPELFRRFKGPMAAFAKKAFASGSKEVITELVANKDVFAFATASEETKTYVSKALIAACKKGQIAFVQRLIERNEHFVAAFASTPLFICLAANMSEELLNKVLCSHAEEEPSSTSDLLLSAFKAGAKQGLFNGLLRIYEHPGFAQFLEFDCINSPLFESALASGDIENSKTLLAYDQILQTLDFVDACMIFEEVYKSKDDMLLSLYMSNTEFMTKVHQLHRTISSAIEYAIQNNMIRSIETMFVGTRPLVTWNSDFIYQALLTSIDVENDTLIRRIMTGPAMHMDLSSTERYVLITQALKKSNEEIILVFLNSFIDRNPGTTSEILNTALEKNWTRVLDKLFETDEEEQSLVSSLHYDTLLRALTEAISAKWSLHGIQKLLEMCFANETLANNSHVFFHLIQRVITSHNGPVLQMFVNHEHWYESLTGPNDALFELLLEAIKTGKRDLVNIIKESPLIDKMAEEGPLMYSLALAGIGEFELANAITARALYLSMNDG